MDQVQRLILINQYRILGGIFKAEKDIFDQAIGALEGGYEDEINELINHDVLNIVTAGQCKEVKAILDMYRHINASILEMSAEDAELAREDEFVQFKGFDANDEPDQYAYTTYLIKECGKWPELDNGASSLNSHIRTLDKYRAMLEVYESYDKTSPLTLDQLKELADA